MGKSFKTTIHMIQSVGIDVSQEDFDVCFKETKKAGSSVIKGTKNFNNDENGFGNLISWANKRRKSGATLVFVMEATGVYYEDLCYYLHENGETVFVELPQKIKYFAKSLNIKTKTDKVDAKIIADVGLERFRSLNQWTPPSKQFKAIRDLSRNLSQMKKNKTSVACQLHAWKTAHETDPEVLTLMEEHLRGIDRLIEKIQGNLIKKAKEDEELWQRVQRVATIKGVGEITVIKIIAETNGFLLFNNIRQLVSYAGLDIIEHQSGKFKGQAKLSKKGNAHIREALYMPAITAGNNPGPLQVYYDRLKGKFQAKKQGLVGVMRKLLVLIYTLWKSGEAYDPTFEWTGGNKKREASLPQ